MAGKLAFNCDLQLASGCSSSGSCPAVVMLQQVIYLFRSSSLATFPVCAALRQPAQPHARLRVGRRGGRGEGTRAGCVQVVAHQEKALEGRMFLT